MIENPFDLTGRVALITGGGTGIGRATALEMIELGAKVAICSRKPEHLEPTLKELSSRGEAIALPCDSSRSIAPQMP